MKMAKGLPISKSQTIDYLWFGKEISTSLVFPSRIIHTIERHPELDRHPK